MTSSKIVVYTAISKGYDSLAPVLPLWRNNARFVAFLEEPHEAPGWEVLPLCRTFTDSCRNAKIHKILPHRYFPDADYSLWIDGSVVLKSQLPIQQWPEEFLSEHDLIVFKHRWRDCIYAEGEWCMKQKLDLIDVIDEQMEKYFDEGYPMQNGLAHCLVLFRRHCPKVKHFNEAWWREINAHSRRDQLSFNYVAHKQRFNFAHFPGNIGNTPHFAWRKHTGPRSLCLGRRITSSRPRA
jgi:hypothetical protein